MRRTYLGMGSNLGDRIDTLRRALDAIGALEGTHIEGVSPVAESEPWGVPDQPMFANIVAEVLTSIPTDRLLKALKGVEAALGRRAGVRYGPRPIDIDILLVGDEEWDTPELVVPHPRLLERDFVVTPLLGLAPDVRMPDGSPVTAAHATAGRITRWLGVVPGYEDRTRPPHGVPAPTEARTVVGAGEWTSVAESVAIAGRGAAYAAELLFAGSVLASEGIPIAWDPMEPGESYNPWGMPRLYRLLVPAAYAPRAREALDEARRAARPPREAEWDVPGEDEEA